MQSGNFVIGCGPYSEMCGNDSTSFHFSPMFFKA